MKGIRWSRRNFAKGLGLAAAGSSVGLPFLPTVRASAADGEPLRLLIAHFPCGTVTERWRPSGGVSDFVLGDISAPFEAVRDKMVMISGLNIIREGGAPGDNHGSGMITVNSGGAPISSPDFDTPIARHASIDQILATQSPHFEGTPVQSIQLAADVRADRDDLYHRVMSYGAPVGDNPWAHPIPPQDRPLEAFNYLFGTTISEGAASLEELEAQRIRRVGVMDYLDRDLDRLSGRVSSDQLNKLVSHRDAVAELRASLDISVSTACVDTAIELEPMIPGKGASHQAIGMSQLQIIKTAFLCDVSRVATFMWAAGTSHVNFSDVIDGVRDQGHHGITHSGSPNDELAMIDTWYAERMTEFLLDLDATDDPLAPGTSVLDNTLVVYISEMARGSHNFQDVPCALFGGACGRLQGGRALQFDDRSYNDLWLAVAHAMDVPLDVFGDEDKSGAPLEGVFEGV